ncbi:hypothetical protein [Alkalihalobacterium alkalinitrilicum]|uniref:hypothetical protein n=1 Tax=Alkalihalobacterium alkalinitrilicum TaxID=427920 RepID=UPI00099542EA|nr:hypothetical protein [Alkalihalobacterium alkalinitrilicum]
MRSKKYLSILTLIFVAFSPILIFYLIDFTHPKMDSTLKNLIFEQAQILSWVVASIMTLVSFTTLFIAFISENKLVKASNTLNQIFYPYNKDIDELKNNFINYKNFIVEDQLLKFIFYIFLFIGWSLTIILGVIIGYYTKFKFSFIPDLTISSFMVFNLYFTLVIFLSLFLLVGWIIHLIRFNKNPTKKGYLPSIENITNVDFLLNEDIDINKFFSINYPYLNFYKNPPSSKPTYESSIELPLPLKNYRFLIKLYSNEQILMTSYGVLSKESFSTHVGKEYFVSLTEEFPRKIFNDLQENDSYGELLIFNKDLNIVARYKLIKKTVSENHFYFVIFKNVSFVEDTIDKKYFEGLGEKSHIDYRVYSSSSN